MFSPNEFVIEIIKHGAEDLRSGGDGLTFDDLKRKMELQGFQTVTPEDHQKIWRVIKTAFIHPQGTGTFNKYYLSIEAYFSLMEYVQLQEARKFSQSSKRLALFAIFLSTASLISAIAFPYVQMQSAVSIDAKQLNAIESRLDTMNAHLADSAKAVSQQNKQVAQTRNLTLRSSGTAQKRAAP